MNPKKAARRRLKILVTAGPTREKIDPVRFISNYSTGTMGYEIAKEAARRAHSVILVSGPTHLEAPKNIRVIPVESALDMRREVLKEFGSADALVMAAAVSDWRPAKAARKKIKKKRAVSLGLVQNPDILLEALRQKNDRILVGFALETESLEKNAREKLNKKGLDFIIANRLAKGRGVFGDTRADYLIMDSFGVSENLRRKSKGELARAIIDKIEELVL